MSPDRTAARRDAASPIHVHFLLLPQTVLLDWAGPAEAMRIANQYLQAHGHDSRFQLHFFGPQSTSASSVGVQLAGLEPLPNLTANASANVHHWVVVLGQVGATFDVSPAPTQQALQWLAQLPLRKGRLELTCICAGAVLAAHAGLLRHRRATTHHQHLEELKRVDPTCEVVANRVFVEDDAIFSSAGVTTGIDLILHRIAQVCDPATAAHVAQTMVMALRRGAEDPQSSPFLAYRQHLHAALHRVQDAVSESPRRSWTVPDMAQVAHTSPRHLARLFLEHTGISPLRYLQHLRLAVAQMALRSGSNVTQAAEKAGFSSDTQLRRTWQLFELPGSPSKVATA